MHIKKFFAKLFIVLAAFFVVLSPIVIVKEAGHHCDHHDDCPICEVVRTAEENLKTTNYTPANTAVIVLIPIAFVLALAIYAISKHIDFSTLVSLKTKLSN